MNVKVQKVGNSVMVTLPQALVKKASLLVGDRVKLAFEEKHNEIRIRRLKRKVTKFKDFFGSIHIPNFDIKDVNKFLEEEYGR